MPSYDQLFKANGFINISVNGGYKRKYSVSFDEVAVSEFGIRCLQIDDASLPGTTSHGQGAIFANAGQWVVQGGGGTNSVKNQNLRVKNSEAVPDPTIDGAKNTVTLDVGSKKPVLSELHTYRFTLDKYKCYLDN